MRVFQIAFEFLMGLIAVLIVLMASAMIAYILKVTIIEILGSEPFKKLKEWYERVLRL